MVGFAAERKFGGEVTHYLSMSVLQKCKAILQALTAHRNGMTVRELQEYLRNTTIHDWSYSTISDQLKGMLWEFRCVYWVEDEGPTGLVRRWRVDHRMAEILREKPNSQKLTNSSRDHSV